MASEPKSWDGFYVRIKFKTKDGKTKQKLRKLPHAFAQLGGMGDSLKAGKERVFTTEDGDDVDCQEDWDVIVEAMKTTDKKYLDVHLEDENSKTSSQSSFSNDYRYTQQQTHQYSPPQPLFPPAPVSKGVKRKLNAAPPSGKRMKLGERQRLKEEKRKNDLAKWTKVRESKTVPFEGFPPEGASEAGGLWYAQLCTICLRPVAFSSLMGHLKGSKHQAEFKKDPRASTFTRQTAITVTEEEAGKYPQWIQQQADEGYHIIYKCTKNKFAELNCYKSEYRVLSLGEQDFSYGLGVARYGCDVVATSYMEDHDSTIPDPVPSQLDDGAREVYQAKTLASMEGDLEKNVKIAAEKGVNIQYGIDATNMKETLADKGVTGDYHCIVFAFPRYSLFRGNDPSNSLLIHGYFKSCLEDKIIQPGGIIQIVCLEGQFVQWDMFQIGVEAGLDLKYMVYLDFNKITPYKPRDLLGKVFSPKDVILCVWQAPMELPSKEEKSKAVDVVETEVIEVGGTDKDDGETEEPSEVEEKKSKTKKSKTKKSKTKKKDEEEQDEQNLEEEQDEYVEESENEHEDEQSPVSDDE